MTKYFGVIGNRDYIKIQGERCPFWEFLDRQPDGWLSSLAYPYKERPVGPHLFDCGAWSYKDADVPMLGRKPMTIDGAIEAYAQRAQDGDMVVAPDHMLLGDDRDVARHRINAEFASAFLGKAPIRWHPVAVVHGTDLPDRIDQARRLRDLGYRHLSLGGLAARASQKSLVMQIVWAVRQAVPEVWLHVLGLSSPTYMAAWREFGVQSCDGSSHFKQAFTAGAFYMHHGGGRLKKFKAARRDTPETDAPECDCCACVRLRAEGIDTRYYGSNENNMGRAAHNLNQLMAAHLEVTHDAVRLPHL